jgi:galactokinase
MTDAQAGGDSRAVAAFLELAGRPPDGVWAAPGRVNLIGEHTDYNEGLVLPFAIEARAEVAAAPRSDSVVRIVSCQRPGDLVTADLSALTSASARGWSAYVLGVIWVLLDEGHRLRGMDLTIDGHVPPGSGLSSSASLECAVAIAVNDVFDLDLPLERLAALCQRAENEVVGAPTGPMDQLASMLCTEGHALLLDTRDMFTRLVPLDVGAGGLALLVVDSRVHHAHADGAYADRRRACEEARAELGLRSLRELSPDDLDARTRTLAPELRRRVRHVVTENARTKTAVAALEDRDWEGVGRAMTASHASLRDDYEVSCRELDVLVDAAIEAGAVGARMTGGGFGGAAIVLAAGDQTGSVTESVKAAFAAHGFAEPHAFPVRPSAGARRIA